MARRLGITRSGLIQQALVHEIEQVEAGLERRARAKSLQARAGISNETEVLDRVLDESLPGEKKGWRNG